MKSNDPSNLPDGTYGAVVKSGVFRTHRRERGRDGIELILGVTGPDGLDYEVTYFADLSNQDCLSATFASGQDFLTCVDPTELVAKACYAVVRRRPWLLSRPWVEAVFLEPLVKESESEASK